MKNNTKYYYVIVDRDGSYPEVGEELYDTYEEAAKAAEFWEDDWRFGSYEICLEEC